MGIYMIRIHHGGNMKVIPNVNSREYTLEKLRDDVMKYGIDRVTAAQDYLALRMKFDVSDSSEQVYVAGEESVVEMFARNKKYMEVELYVETEIAIPLTIVDGNNLLSSDSEEEVGDPSSKVGVQGESSNKEDAPPEKKVGRTRPIILRKCKTTCGAAGRAAEEPKFVDLTGVATSSDDSDRSTEEGTKVYFEGSQYSSGKTARNKSTSAASAGKGKRVRKQR